MSRSSEVLDDINPFSSQDVEGWSESPSGCQTLERVLNTTTDGLATPDNQEERRRRPWFVAATAAAVVLALAIPAALLMRSQDGVSPGGGGLAQIDGVWILDSFKAGGEFTGVEVGVNSAELPFIEFGPQVSGSTGCNGFSTNRDGVTLDEGTLTLTDVFVTDKLCDSADGKGLMLTPSVFRQALTTPLRIAVSGIGDNMQWIVAGDAQLFFVREDRGIELTEEEIRQVPIWVNQLGLAQFHPVVWRDRFDRVCGEGVWNPDVAVRLSAQFINTDLDAGASVRVGNAGAPLTEDGALALWAMAANTCPSRFPTGAIDQGPPTFVGGNEPPSKQGVDAFVPSPVLLGENHVWPEGPRAGQPTEIATAFAVEVLGWETPSARGDPRADPSGPVWVRLSQEGIAALVDVLTVPAAGGGRVLVQIGVPWAKGIDLGMIEQGRPGSTISLIRVAGAETAELTIRLGSGSQVVVTADRNDIGNGRLEVRDISDPAEIASVLIRYVDSENRVIAATGDAF